MPELSPNKTQLYYNTIVNTRKINSKSISGTVIMQSILQTLYGNIEIMLQPIYQIAEQIRFLIAVVINSIVALCFAQTLENRATAVSRAIYLIIMWAILPVALNLVDAFYEILGFAERENMQQWTWLIIPVILATLCASYAVALVVAWRKEKQRNILDLLLFTVALLLMAHRFYQHYS